MPRLRKNAFQLQGPQEAPNFGSPTLPPVPQAPVPIQGPQGPPLPQAPVAQAAVAPPPPPTAQQSFADFRLGDPNNAQGGLGGLVDIAGQFGGLGSNFGLVQDAALRELPGRFQNDQGQFESDVVIADRIRRLFGEGGTTGQGDLFFEGGERRSGSLGAQGGGGGSGGGGGQGGGGGGGGGQGGGGQFFPPGGFGFFPPQGPPNSGGPVGNTPPGIFPTQRPPTLDPNNFDPSLGAPPAQGIDFGTSPFSQLIEGGIADVIREGGQPVSPFAQQVRQGIGGQLDVLGQSSAAGGLNPAVEGALTDLLNGGRGIESFIDDRIIDQNTASLRENLDRQRRATTGQLEAELSGRGLLGSGPERTGREGIFRDIASRFATGARDIGADELGRARGTFETALGIGESGRQANLQGTRDLLGLGQDAASLDQASLLAGLDLGTERQSFLTDAALGLLDRNQSASQFQAQQGLQREQFLESLQNNQLLQLLPLIQNFIGGAGAAQRGAI